MIGVERARGVPHRSSVAVVVAAAAVVVGAAVALDDRVGVVLAAVGVTAVVTLLGNVPIERAAIWLLLGGTVVLGYGFANLGLKVGGPPIPLTEMLLVPLVVWALLDPRTRVPAAVLTPLIIFGAIVGVRLVADYPRYEVLAIRDTTLAIEAFALVVGYRVVARDGIAPWVRRLAVLFGVLLVYSTFYPWRGFLSDLGPTVGLQRGVPLFGSFQGLAPRLGVAIMFFAIFTVGAKRVLLVGWALALALIRQSRGLYLVIPVAAIVMGWVRRASGRVLLGGLALLLPGLVFLSLLVGAGGQGRVGEVTPDFYTGHLGTLLGGEGPAAGTLDDRVEWATKTLDATAESPGTLLFGTGLGPDLTFGFRQGGDILVRKPHNDLLEVFARTGVVGLGVFLWLLVAALAPIVRRARREQDRAGTFCSFVVAAAVIMLGISLTQPLLAFPYGAVPTFFLLGMGVAAARRPPGLSGEAGTGHVAG